jgi:hypothetical protein
MTRTIAILAVGLLLVGTTSRAQETAATKELTAWNAEFTPDIVEVAPGVFTAIGYGGSTISMIVGDGGVVMIDAGSAVNDAARAREAFRRISKAPVRGIVYTHGHRDHTTGGSVWVEAGAPAPEVWAHERFGIELGTFDRAGLTINRARSARQFGSALPPAKRINDGIAPVSPAAGGAPTTPPAKPPVLVPVPPTKFVQERRRSRSPASPWNSSPILARPKMSSTSGCRRSGCCSRATTSIGRCRISMRSGAHRIVM